MALRRDIRLRKDFLYKKQQAAIQDARDTKKKYIKRAINEQKSVPTELRTEARQLHHENEMDLKPLDAYDDGSDPTTQTQSIDDEYATIGIKDPKVCVTTSRDPSSRLKSFSKEIKLCIPNSVALNRGNTRTDELTNVCKQNDFTDVVIVGETRGNPDLLIVSHLPYGPTAYFNISNTILRHDIPEVGQSSTAYPHLIFEGLASKVGLRFKRILQALYPIPKPDSKRIITFANTDDILSFRHHMVEKTKTGKTELKEAGPRFELRPFEIRMGTFDQDTAEKEWVFRPYMNSAKRRKHM
jgi:U3 small nucleolar ribonucleoprotein protein IMP4